MILSEANTTVLTTSLGSLAADLVAIGGRPPRAGRRVATVACIFVGAVVGALLQRHGVGWPLGLALVLVVLAGWMLALAGWPAPTE
jgi:peptidoglycan/LPS O-acetylase OafA/YrhL